MGPFHKTVFALAISAAKDLAVSGPMSKPIMPSGTKAAGTTERGASSLISAAATTSVGSKIFTPFAAARASTSLAKSACSASYSDVPIVPPRTDRNVKAMPPPIRIVSALSSMCSITPILSETFAPPSTSTYGFSGADLTRSSASTSRAIKKPA